MWNRGLVNKDTFSKSDPCCIVRRLFVIKCCFFIRSLLLARCSCCSDHPTAAAARQSPQIPQHHCLFASTFAFLLMLISSWAIPEWPRPPSTFAFDLCEHLICVNEQLQQKSLSGLWTEVGRTEVVQNNLNPIFKTKIETDFTFEKKQDLKFILYDWYKPCKHKYVRNKTNECILVQIHASTCTSTNTQTHAHAHYVLPLSDSAWHIPDPALPLVFSLLNTHKRIRTHECTHTHATKKKNLPPISPPSLCYLVTHTHIQKHKLNTSIRAHHTFWAGMARVKSWKTMTSLALSKLPWEPLWARGVRPWGPCIYVHARRHKYTHTHTLKLTLTATLTHVHAQTHAHTHTHTHT